MRPKCHEKVKKQLKKNTNIVLVSTTMTTDREVMAQVNKANKKIKEHLTVDVK